MIFYFQRLFNKQNINYNIYKILYSMRIEITKQC